MNAEAIAAYEKLCQLDPESPLSYFTLGRAHYLAKDYALALEQFKKCLELSPTYLLAYLFVGQSYEKLGDHAAAVRVYQTALAQAQTQGDKKFVQQFEALLTTL